MSPLTGLSAKLLHSAHNSAKRACASAILRPCIGQATDSPACRSWSWQLHPDAHVRPACKKGLTSLTIRSLAQKRSSENALSTDLITDPSFAPANTETSHTWRKQEEMGISHDNTNASAPPPPMCEVWWCAAEQASIKVGAPRQASDHRPVALDAKELDDAPDLAEPFRPPSQPAENRSAHSFKDMVPPWDPHSAREEKAVPLDLHKRPDGDHELWKEILHIGHAALDALVRTPTPDALEAKPDQGDVRPALEEECPQHREDFVRERHVAVAKIGDRRRTEMHMCSPEPFAMCSKIGNAS